MGQWAWTLKARNFFSFSFNLSLFVISHSLAVHCEWFAYVRFLCEFTHTHTYSRTRRICTYIQVGLQFRRFLQSAGTEHTLAVYTKLQLFAMTQTLSAMHTIHIGIVCIMEYPYLHLYLCIDDSILYLSKSRCWQHLKQPCAHSIK